MSLYRHCLILPQGQAYCRQVSRILRVHQSVTNAVVKFKSTNSNDDNGTGTTGKPDPDSAKKKLNDLLKSIVEDSNSKKDKPSTVKPLISYSLAAPIKKRKIRIEPKKEEPEKSMETPAGEEKEEDLSPELKSAVKKVAQDMKGEDREIVESELVRKLKSSAAVKVDLNELFQGMKIDKTQERKPMVEDFQRPDSEMYGSRAQRVRRILQDRQQHRPGVRREFDSEGDGRRVRPTLGSGNYVYTPIDLFGASPLGIFATPKTTIPDAPDLLKTWKKINDKELKLMSTHPPANGFEEMILWTEQGKMWHYPINNHQGMDAEAKVPFHEHVFLEPHLESWCPKQGPIRHFMELVCVALGKNAFLSAQEKREHIEWYHQYFKSKADIIKEVGAGEIK